MSNTPENSFLINSKHYAVSEVITINMAIIRDLFMNLIEVSEVLNIDKRFRKQLIDKKEKLFSYQIGSKVQLQE